MESKIDILSVPIWNLTLEEAKDLVFQWIEEGKAASIATANAEMLMRAKEDEELANILRHADLVVPDGAGVLWAAEQQGKKFKERVAGFDLSCRLLQEAAVPALLAVYFTYFFRNPKRCVPRDESALVSPADGKVMSVEEVEDDLYLNARCRKIVIFLSIFDAHVNRTPLAGTIKFQQYTCGRFRPAYKDGVGFENERYSLGIENERTRILVTLIAGVLARRVVSWVTLGDTLLHGQLYGMIKFGSCIEVFVEDNVDIYVKKGDFVRGGETIIGRIVE